MDTALAREGLGQGAEVALPFIRNEPRARFIPISELVEAIVIISTLLPGAAMVREKQRGTIEQLLVVPLSPIEIMLPKVIAMTGVTLLGVSITLFAIVACHLPCLGLSVVLVEAHTDNVVPARRVMALEALFHKSMLFSGEFPGDHREVTHRMAGWRLMTLYTLLGLGGRVLIVDHDPRIERMALSAVIAEPLDVRVPAIVASGAVEGIARCVCVELTRVANP